MAKKGRSTVYNLITSEEKLRLVNPKNTELENDFLDYLESIDRAASTIEQYKANLHVFWCWNLDNNNNKFFVELSKREIAKFQSYAIKQWGWSPSRIRTVKATLSSLSNYIENILDDEYENYRPIVRKIESPVNEPVRDKAVFQLNELQAVLDQLVERGKILAACVLALAMYSGRRKAELTRFKVSYFDEENLICGGALYKTPEKMVTKGRGSKGKMLDVYILAKPFKSYFDLWMRERNRQGIKSHYLFPDYTNGKWFDAPMETSRIDSIFKTIERFLGRPIYPHAMRHFFTSYLLEQNLPEAIVQNIIGWSSSDMVRLYDDRPTDSQLEKYFGAEGIKQISKKDLNDL